jgi:hypothetical protein
MALNKGSISLWLALLPVWLPVSGVQAATVAICPGQPADSAGMLVREIRDTEAGTRFLVVADNASALADCQVTDIPVNADSAGWIGTARPGLSDEAPVSLTLIGQFDSAPWQVSEINVPTRADKEQPAVLPMPYAENLMANFVARIFGREERAVWLEGDGALLCRTGSEPAGLVLEATRAWYGNPQLQLELQYSGMGTIDVAIAGPDAASLENPVFVDTIRPADKSQTTRLLLPENTGQWQSLVFICPEQQAELALTTMRLQPGLVSGNSERSAWFWTPAAWQARSAELIMLAREYRLNRLYVSVPTNRMNEVTGQELLGRFISAMHAEGIEVWAVAGDPGDVLESSHAALQNRMHAYLAYNETAGSSSRLSGVQLDIEPYLLPGFTANDADWQRRYRDTISLAAAALDRQMPLSVVVPVWWGSNQLWGTTLLDQLQQDISSITVMNYRTSAGALRVGSLPFLYWSQQAGMPLEMALETGSVGPDQTRLNFARADMGRLLLIRVGETDLILLMNEAVRFENGVIYQQVASSVVPSSNTSFKGNIADMEAVLGTVVPEWSAWDSFSGIAIHGLEEHFLVP